MPRQFKSTDTSQWVEQFGTGKDGSLTVSSASDEFKVANGIYTTNANAYGAFTGTSGNSSGTASDAYGFWTNYVFVGDYVLIHQSQGTGAGNWELNVVTGGIPSSGGSSTLTLKYPLQNSYTTGCQIVKCPQFTDFTINSGSVTYTPAWDGTKFGITAFFVNGTATITGSINTASRGFRGGAGRDFGSLSFTGENYGNTGLNQISASFNGGGGSDGDNGAGRGAGGGGGGNLSTGGNGGIEGGSAQGGGAGGTSSSSDCTIVTFGGGGGGGSRTGSGTYPAGGAGAGIVMIFAKNIVVTGAQGIIAEGSKGISSSDGMGGSGAGGSILIKTITATLGTNLITSLGGTVTTYGGQGGTGPIHLDYAGSYTGTTNPTLSATQDSSLYPSGGSFIFNML